MTSLGLSGTGYRRADILAKKMFRDINYLSCLHFILLFLFVINKTRVVYCACYIFRWIFFLALLLPVKSVKVKHV